MSLWRLGIAIEIKSMQDTIEKLNVLADSWSSKAEKLAKAAFDGNKDEWLDEQTFGEYTTLVDCSAELRKLIRSLIPYD